MQKTYTKKEIEQFWVGLVDADGSVQCNHWRKKTLQYRIVIEMHVDNLEMLTIIRQNLGGSVRTIDKDTCLWVEDHTRRIRELCKIFDSYPPLTTRVQGQVTFLLECLARRDVEWMLQNRDDRYKDRESISREITRKGIVSRHYFKIWCSGFITGEGCFSVRKDSSKSRSFSIAQKNDRYLIEALRDYFDGKNRVRLLKDNVYLWEVYRRDVLKNIIAHCERFPLLGHKNTQLDIFKQDL